MFVFAFVLGFLSINTGSCNSQQKAAADAIQQSLFGGDDAVEEPFAEALYSDDRSMEIARKSSSRGRQGSAGKKSYSFADLGRLNVEVAPTQQVVYRPSNYDNVPVVDTCPEVKCHLSLAVVLDSSGSVGLQNFGLELDFIRTLLEIMAIKAHDNSVVLCTGIVVYSTRVSVAVNPCCQNSMCRVVDQFSQNQIPYQPGSTNTHGALKVARQMLQATSSYKKVVLLITDGKSNTGGSPNAFAKQMREHDQIDIVALGVGDNVNEGELRAMSGYEFVTRITYFDEFHELASILLEANYVGDAHDLDSTFEELCKDDTSKFSSTCDKSESEDDEEEEDSCAWGNWSNCISKQGSCSQRRTCKLNGAVVDDETRECTCQQLKKGSFMSSLRQQSRQRHQRIGRHG